MKPVNYEERVEEVEDDENNVSDLFNGAFADPCDSCGGKGCEDCDNCGYAT